MPLDRPGRFPVPQQPVCGQNSNPYRPVLVVATYERSGRYFLPGGTPKLAAHPSADIYAWGRVVVFLLTGRTAVDAVAHVPGAWRELLTACTSVVPEQRPAGGAVKDLLEGDVR